MLITRIAKGLDALRALVGSMLKVRVPLRWYLLPFVVFPVITPLLQFSAPTQDWDWRELAIAYVTGFLPALAFQFLSTNLWEETGWQGLVQNTFQDRYGPWKAVLLTTPWSCSSTVGASVMMVLFGSWGSTGFAYVVPGILVLILTKGRLGVPSRPLLVRRRAEEAQPHRS